MNLNIVAKGNWWHGKRKLAAAAGLAAAIAGALPLGSLRAATDDALQEIVVTAQRRSQTLQDVPIAISAFSAQDMADRGVRMANEIATSVPNMTLSTPFGPEGMPVFSIRGVSESDYTQHQSSPIAMYVDEVYKSIGAVQSQQIYDIERVEVLRGPQGTLYGKNATGGAVSFYTSDPNLSHYEGYFTGGAGNYSDVSVRAAVSGPIVDDTFGWRAAIYYENRNGWENSTTAGVKPLAGVDVLAGRLTLLWKPADNLVARFKFAASDSKGTPYGTRPFNLDPTITGYSGSVSWFQTNDKFAIPQSIRNDSASLKLDWTINNNYTLTSVTGYDYGYWYILSDDQGLGFNDAGVPIHIADPDIYLTSVNEFSQEVRIASHDLGRFEWLGGLYYGRDKTHLTQQYQFFDSFPGTFVLTPGQVSYGYNQYNSFDQTRDTRAAFLNASFKVTPDVTLRAGVRYTNDKITIDNYYALQGGLAGPPVGLGPNTGTAYWSQTIPLIPSSLLTFLPSLAQQSAPTPSFGQTNSNISGMVGADWKAAEGVLVYASISQGYRGAAFNGQAYISSKELTFAKPEILRSYEIGLKSEFWERRAVVNAAVFYYDYRDLQFLDNFQLGPNQGFGQDITNAPKSRIKGGELELRLKPIHDVEVHAGVGLQDARFVSLTLHGVSLANNKLFQAPDTSLNMSVDWKFLHLTPGDVRFHIDGNYYSKQYWDPRNVERVAQSGYALANARLSFDGTQKPGFQAGLWVKNLTNKRYNTYELAERNPVDGGFGEDQALAGEPRTYGVDVTYRF